MECSIRFIADRRSIVRSVSNPVMSDDAKCSHCSGVIRSPWVSRMYSAADTRNPAVPHAGSQIRSSGVGLKQPHHQVADMLRRAELPVLAGRGQLAQHVFVKVSLHIEILDVMLIQLVQARDDLLQHLRRRNDEDGVLHVREKAVA